MKVQNHVRAHRYINVKCHRYNNLVLVLEEGVEPS